MVSSLNQAVGDPAHGGNYRYATKLFGGIHDDLRRPGDAGRVAYRRSPKLHDL